MAATDRKQLVAPVEDAASTSESDSPTESGQFLKTGYGKALAATCGALALWAVKRARDVMRNGGKLQDTRLVGSLIENACCVGLCCFREAAVPKTERVKKEYPLGKKLKVMLYNLVVSILGGIVVEEGAVLLLHLASTVLYKHVPYFRTPSRNTNPFTMVGFKSWLKGNARGQLLGNAFQVVVESQLSDKSWEEMENTKFDFKMFLQHVVQYRILLDMAFYVSHRTMHLSPWIYQHVHKRHHTHFSTNLPTNYRFTMLDVLFESAVPIGVAMLTLSGIGHKFSRFETNLLVCYTAWHESGTHTGKPVPLISMFPPFSALYNAVYDVDGRAIEFHETHHNRIRCNYGITPWIDYLCGTMVMGKAAKDV
eukprot:TRINITY_DN643_c4_g1_i1.p1 TRINITY_DN643_c4_g1~~TRINITY_DN643_c4_g1_i1.p1  ORF type:complete len:367 (+),score=120.23 TRINITY_DN643_c4_g1_i1:141-1241(+)